MQAAWNNSTFGTVLLEFVVVKDRLRLECACRGFKATVVESGVWVTVEVPTSVTDEGLAALLRKVRAVERTRRLSLRDCRLVAGEGLRPLTRSDVLEEVDLWMGPRCLADASVWEEEATSRLDVDVVASILTENAARSTSRLRRVAIRPTLNEWAHYEDAAPGLVSAIGDRMNAEAAAGRHQCAQCCETITDWWCDPCDRCGARFCNDCADKASECAEECHYCHFKLCGRCAAKDLGFIMNCAECQVPACWDCVERAFCDGPLCDASDAYCTLCRYVDQCEGCERSMCRTCQLEDEDFDDDDDDDDEGRPFGWVRCLDCESVVCQSCSCFPRLCSGTQRRFHRLAATSTLPYSFQDEPQCVDLRRKAAAARDAAAATSSQVSS